MKKLTLAKEEKEIWNKIPILYFKNSTSGCSIVNVNE
jgi:hypothetical protein